MNKKYTLDRIKLMIRRFNQYDHYSLQKLGETHMLTIGNIEQFAADMQAPHKAAIENIKKHLWELQNTEVDKPCKVKVKKKRNTSNSKRKTNCAT
jgi:hypothetical protein